MTRPGASTLVFASILCVASFGGRGASAQTDSTPPLSDAAIEYASNLSKILRRGFVMPSEIPVDQYAGLSVSVFVVLGEDLRFRSLLIAQRSGNEAFDRRVEAHLASVRAMNPTLPAPPAHEWSRFIGPRLGVRFRPPGNPRRAPSGSSNHVLDNLGAGYR